MTPQKLREKMTEACDDYFMAKPYRNSGGIHGILNTIVGAGPDLTTLKADVISAKDDSSVIKEKIKALDATDILDNFATGSDANMRTFIDGKMPGLSDSQQLAVALLLQRIKE